MSARLSIGSTMLFIASLAACGDGLPTFPPVPKDSGIECTAATDGGGEPRACAADQVCVQGRCHPACTGDADCGSREMCGASGLCVPRTTTRPDAGVDAGPIDPCADLMCDPQVCHPTLGVCVDCLDRAACPGATPVCDVGRGVCRLFAPRVCSPCNADGDCIDPMTATDYGDCVTRPEENEAICATTCMMPSECAPGLDCVSGHCLPRLGSCYAFNAAIDGTACGVDADCASLGSAYVAPGQCLGATVATEDGGAGTMGVCRQPCGIASDCPAGRSCVDDFCVPM